MTFPTTFSEGSDDIGLVCLTGVVTQRSGAAVDDVKEDGPPGFSTGVLSSSIGVGFAVSSSESGSDVFLASSSPCFGVGSRCALGIAGSGAFQKGFVSLSNDSLWWFASCCRRGLPPCVPLHHWTRVIFSVKPDTRSGQLFRQ